jgi:hypothetical protein
MPMTAIVAVSLARADAEQKRKLSAFLDSRDWIAVPNIEGTWAGSFPDADPNLAESRDAICEHAAVVVREAAQASGLVQYDAVVHVGVAVPTLFSGP